ncbi:integrase [Billgrantia azerbaijanica]|nr:integrase [Halomonas azerbaijanica]
MSPPPVKRGRRRGHNPHIPAHIDQAKLPDGVYYDHRGRGNWYTLYQDGDRRRRKNIATARATLAELHQIMQDRQRSDRHTLRWLAEQFHASDQFTRLAKKTQDSYRYSCKVLERTKTKAGPAFIDLDRHRITPAIVQRLVDRLARDGTPAKANHVAAYLRRIYRWGINRGHCSSNPAWTIEAAQERQRRRLPERHVLTRVTQFCHERSQGTTTAKGAVAPYMWALIEIAYLCRLRAIEVLTLTDANATPAGIRTNRRKGSRDNLVRWNERLRHAWDAAIATRNARWAKKGRAVPLDPARRPLFIGTGGDALTRHGLDSAWFRMMAAAVDAGVITQEEKFGLHDLKRRGITDTHGTRHDKQEASGHRSERMLDVYDLSLPEVDPSSL